jgi:hypothetical protein
MKHEISAVAEEPTADVAQMHSTLADNYRVVGQCRSSRVALSRSPREWSDIREARLHRRQRYRLIRRAYVTSKSREQAIQYQMTGNVA